MPDASFLEAVLLYCRPGFEKEAAAELQQAAQRLDAEGYIKAAANSGFVLFVPYDTAAMSSLSQELRYRSLIFARQLVFIGPELSDLPVGDRITPLLGAAARLGKHFSQIMLETADTNEAKELSGFVRKFTAPFERAARAKQFIGDHVKPSAPRLHVFFADSSHAHVGISRASNASPWLMGIPRLRFPSSAPSRSTLKLDEAFLYFLGEDPKQLQPGMTAVDLGAAPGGWTWQLVKRSIRVIAVDNGAMDRSLLESGIVDHQRADGFRFRPAKPVDWLVCDMVEKPARVAQLIANWMAEGHCRHAIFNLKLPMKKRFEETQLCRRLIESCLDDAEIPFRLDFKQLYHDREEITGYLTKLSR